MYRWVWRIVSPRRAGEAKPLENVDSITMYGSGNETALVGDTARTISQVTEAVRDSMGLDLAQLLSSAVAGRAAGAAAADASASSADISKETK